MQWIPLHPVPSEEIATTYCGKIVAIGCPGEGHNASYMQMRTQRPDRFARRTINGFCKAVLPVPGCKVRAHMGREPDVFTHAEPVSSVIRKDVVRPFEGYAQSKAAGAV